MTNKTGKPARFGMPMGLAAGIVAIMTAGTVTANAAIKSTDAYPGHILKRGTSGTAVKALQVKLNAIGDKVGSVDGDFGPATQAAVIKFEKSHRLPANGIVTARVWTALFPPLQSPSAYPGHILKRGSMGAPVKALQVRLNAIGDKVGSVDGDFGPATQAAVVKFEKSHRFRTNGIVNASVWDALFPSGHAQTKPSNPKPTAKTPPVSPVTIKPLFEVGPGMALQSVGYTNGMYYVGYSTATNDSIVQNYNSRGQLLAQTGVLPIQHCASISVDPSTGNLVITNGGGTDPTQVYMVNFATQAIISDINLTELGNSGVGAVDKATGNIWVETAPNDHGELTFSYVTPAGQILKQFNLANQGVPQGIDVANGTIYYYTDNKVTLISTSGQVLKSMAVKEPGESEGLVVLPSGQVVVGFQYRHDNTTTNTLYEITGFHE